MPNALFADSVALRRRPSRSSFNGFRSCSRIDVRLNPKVAIFFLALLPQFIDPAAGLGPMPFLFLGAIFVAGGTLWCLGQAMCAASATRTIRPNPALLRWLERVSGCVYEEYPSKNSEMALMDARALQS
jgi:threonine/homoserine/homoserine lactone efflux protein